LHRSRKLSVPTLTLGKHNPRIAEIRRAVRDGGLTADGLLPVEGPRLIDEAVRSGLEITEAYRRRGERIANLPSGCPVYELDDTTFHRIQGTETSQGVLALARPRQFSLREVARAGRGPIMTLAELQDPGNVGTIFRATESFEGGACLGLRGSASPYNPKAVRASAGSVFRLPHVWGLDFDELATELASAGVPIIATAPTASRTIAEWDWSRPTAVLIGNEGAGVRPDILARCEATLAVPHSAAVESLNSAVAAAVILYEAYRRRGEAR
jgi:TrmH family RNA methyltransferase